MKTLSLTLAALCALFLLNPEISRAGTMVNFGTISQIDSPGGLDLAGEMAYAINFSANDPAMFVNGVKFTPDTALPDGLTVGLNQVAPWQTKPNFGSGVDNDNLEEVYQDIRFALPASGQALEAHLPVTIGETYKIQVLVYGNHAGDNRRWDIEVEGAIGVDEFTSLGASDAGGVLPAYAANAGVVYTHTITAADAALDVRMGDFGGLNDAGDRNCLWQGLTVEHIVPDTDSDGLPDSWEVANFVVITAQTGAGDADSDGLSNQYEYQIGLNPTTGTADTDGDGLLDVVEYFNTRTNPLLIDSDGDSLNDGAEDADADGASNLVEINAGTNPFDRDSDDDEYLDGLEISSGTNPLSASSFPLYSAQVLSFSGGDQGEGLDFSGNFIAAARFGITSISGSWPVRDATFIPYHSVPGLVEDTNAEVDAWTTMTFSGPLTVDDNNLATVMHSIRYRGSAVNLALSGLTAGRSYKLQLLFAENCCPNRGFDVYVENTLVADEFSPPAVQGGAAASPARGAAVVYGFVAGDSTLNIRLDKATVTTPSLNDPNPIINAFSLEEIVAAADVDADGLPDTWEVDNFGPNLAAQNGTGDPDNDGLPNSQELASNTNPNNPDSDSDGLTDGAEINTHGTNPKSADTDGDGLTDGNEVNTTHTNPANADSDNDTLSDGAEVLTHGSNPNSIDTDNDGFNDPTELINGTSPILPASTPGSSHIARVLGADPGEGLDLRGNFPFAINVGPDGAIGIVGDADFSGDTDAGFTVIAPHEIATPGWALPNFGSSADDDGLERVYQDIRWAQVDHPDPAMQYQTVELANLTPGRQYKLQLLFGEQCCPQRTFDVSVEGNLIADDFNMGNAQGPVPMTIAGAAIVHTFTAGDDTLNILLDGRGVPFVPGIDRNAILSGVTLEELTEPVPLDIVGVTSAPGSITLNVRGTPGHVYSVDYSTDLQTWEEVQDALVPDGFGNATWTDNNPSRVGPAIRRSYYRARDPVLDPTP